jgi:dGTP triphosphohydrolase
MTAPSLAKTPLYRQSDFERFYDEDQLAHLQAPCFIGPFRADVVRVMQARFFRRLQGKTQLLPAGESDYFRNRLTHSLEVAGVAEMIALKVNSLRALPATLLTKIWFVSLPYATTLDIHRSHIKGSVL